MELSTRPLLPLFFINSFTLIIYVLFLTNRYGDLSTQGQSSTPETYFITLNDSLNGVRFDPDQRDKQSTKWWFRTVRKEKHPNSSDG